MIFYLLEIFTVFTKKPIFDILILQKQIQTYKIIILNLYTSYKLSKKAIK